MSLKLDLSAERTLMGGFVPGLDFLLLTFEEEPAMDVCELTMGAVAGFSSSCGRRPGKGFLKAMKGEGGSMEEGLC